MSNPERALQMERVLVTGGAGFIGSHLVDRLINEGHEVIVYDNFSSGNHAWAEALASERRLRVIEADLADLAVLAKSMAGVDVVWHLAGNIDIPGAVSRTDLDLRGSIVGTYNVLEAMRLNGVRRVVFASSGTVYGDLCRDEPATEDTGPLLPLSLYAAGKISAESLISGFSHLFGMIGLIFRFGNIVGDRMTRGAIHDFIAKLRRNPNQLEILGDGRQRKPYILIEDCLNAMVLGLRAVSLDSSEHVDVFNISSDSTTSADEIARIVADEMGLQHVQMTHTGGEQGWPGDQPQVRMLADKLNRLGWMPSVTSNEAVRLATRRMLLAPVFDVV